MPQDHKKNRVIPQSISVNDEEKLAIAVLAAGEGIRPGTFTRQIFYRGLAGYVADRNIELEEPEEETFAKALRLIEEDSKLSRLKVLLTQKRDIEKDTKAGRVYSSPNVSEEAEEQTDAPKAEGKRGRR